MLQKKKKITRKELKEDKLVTFVNKSTSFFEDYKNKIVTYGAVVVVAIAAVYFYLNQRAEDNLVAATELSRVLPLYEQGSYLEAIEGRQGTNIIGLKKIVEDYGTTENGETAKIYLANAYNYLGNQEEAIKYYEEYDGSIDYLKAASLAGRAGYYAGSGDYKRAADMYLSAAKISELNAENPNYLLNAGIYYMKIGNQEEAEAVFNQIKDEYATSIAGREVNKYLAQIQQ
jgi:tetratricopeptide (TPR) repeat protein